MSCAMCALRTDYCDACFDRAEYPAAWPFAFRGEALPHLEALPASQVVVSSCRAGRDVYAPEATGPCDDFVDARHEPQVVYWPFAMPRSLDDHAW